MDAIARQADVSKATLYAHYSNKETLFVAVMQTLMGNYQQHLIGLSTSTGTTFGERLHALGGAMAEFLTQPWILQMFRVIISENARIPEIAQSAIQSGREHTHQVLSRFFHSGVELGELRDHRPEEAARLFMAMMRGSILWEALVNPNVTLDAQQLSQDIDTLVSHIHCLYANPEHTKPSASQGHDHGQ